MRVSVYDHDFKPRGYMVWINGKRVTHCFEADEEDGWVRAAMLDKDGRPMVDHTERSVIAHVLNGRVSIIDPALLPVVL